MKEGSCHAGGWLRWACCALQDASHSTLSKGELSEGAGLHFRRDLPLGSPAWAQLYCVAASHCLCRAENRRARSGRAGNPAALRPKCGASAVTMAYFLRLCPSILSWGFKRSMGCLQSRPEHSAVVWNRRQVRLAQTRSQCCRFAIILLWQCTLLPLALGGGCPTGLPKWTSV